jgi:hypothetical protein
MLLFKPGSSQNDVFDIVRSAEKLPAFSSLLRDFDTFGVQTWLTPEEKALHFGLGAFNTAGNQIVEIGTFEGGSAIFSMAGLKHRGSGTLYSIDPHLGAPPFLGSAPWQFTLQKFRRNVERASLSDHLRSIVNDSHSASATWPSIPISSVLVDGDHSYEGCLRDVECWATKLVEGGFLLIDDAVGPALREVREVVAGLKLLRGLRFEGEIGDIAIFRKVAGHGFALLAELKEMRVRDGALSQDLEFVHSMPLPPNYREDTVEPDHRVIYQLGFLARCGHGDYLVTSDGGEKAGHAVNAILRDRPGGTSFSDHDVPTIPPETLRLIVCGLDEAIALRELLRPGGVVIARLRSDDDTLHLREREELLDAGFEGCGYGGQYHWGFWRTSFLSHQSISTYIRAGMTGEPLTANPCSTSPHAD